MYAPSTPPASGPWATVDSDAIAFNLDWLQQRLARHCGTTHRPRIWAVVKSDAYGHGLVHALAGLHQADGLCVSSLQEALALRALGYTGPVLLLSLWGVSGEDLQDPQLHPLHVVVDDASQLTLFDHARLPRLHVWLRAAGELRSPGLEPDSYRQAWQHMARLKAAGALLAVGHLHHYAAAEEADALLRERHAFAQLTADLPGPHCSGNSAALCGNHPLSPDGADQWLRAGLVLYGASALPGTTGAHLGLRPAMSVHARLLSVRPVRKGESVGYGGSYRAPVDTRIGMLGIGYGHGIPRNLWERGMILAGDGRPVPLAGRVAMDCLTVDLGADGPDTPGDTFTLWGTSPTGARLPVEQLAQACNTIAAELLTGLTPRVPIIRA